MDKKVIISGFVGAIVSFLLGWLVFSILLHGYYDANTFPFDGLMRKMPNLVAIFVGGFCWTLLIAYIFVNWAGINNFSKGLMAGFILGFFVSASFDCYSYAMMHLMRIRLMAVDVVVNTIFTGILGGVIGLMIGKLEGKSAAS